MPILDNSFTCNNGHTFTANAKVRARCPQCGLLTKRNFLAEVKVPELKPKESETRKEPLLVREGRPRTVSPKGPAKGIPQEPRDKQVALKKSVTTKKATPTRKPPVKSLTKPLGKTASGIVKVSRIATKGQSPQVTRKPKRTAIARHIRVPQKESFMDSVVRRFGPG